MAIFAATLAGATVGFVLTNVLDWSDLAIAVLALLFGLAAQIWVRRRRP